MPVIHTLSFANYRNPTQTDLAKKKGVLDHRTGNSRECPGRRVPVLSPARLLRLSPGELAASKRLRAQARGWQPSQKEFFPVIPAAVLADWPLLHPGGVGGGQPRPDRCY